MAAFTRTAFLGLSHLGIVSSAGWASHGNLTLGLDLDHEIVSRLAKRDVPIYEPGLPELLDQTAECLSYSAKLQELEHCDLVVVSRDVPTDGGNASNVGIVWALLDRAIPHLRQDVVLAIHSQVPPGFTRELEGRLRASRPELRFTLYYWMETLIFGNAVERCLRPERFILGCGDPSAPLDERFDRALSRFGCPVLPMRYESAELTKTAVNFYLSTSVTYANTMADLCEAAGADWSEMVPALRLDARIGPKAYIQPSLGLAGGNLERDLVTLRTAAERDAVDSTLLVTVLAHNQQRYHWLLKQLRKRLFAVTSRPRLALWGLAYKKNTHSTKNSPALRLLNDLGRAAEFRAWDPEVPAERAGVRGGAQYEVLDGADALVIANDWDVFGAADLQRVRSSLARPLIVDCTSMLQKRSAELVDFEYACMGRLT